MLPVCLGQLILARREEDLRHKVVLIVPVQVSLQCGCLLPDKVAMLWLMPGLTAFDCMLYGGPNVSQAYSAFHKSSQFQQSLSLSGCIRPYERWCRIVLLIDEQVPEASGFADCSWACMESLRREVTR